MKAIAAFALAIALATPAAAQDKMTIILDWFVNPDHGPVIVAKEKGYFARNGLSVDIVAPANPTDPPKMVAAGKADLAISYQPQLHLNLHEGMDLVRAGTLVATPLTCLVTLANGPIKKLSDLSGKKVGYAVPGVQEVLLDAMLGNAGVAKTAVERINIGFSISPALMSRQVEGVIGAFRNFELNQMAIEGIAGKCFYPEDEGVPAYDELIYVANPKTMNKERTARFMAATELATQYILNNPKDAWEVFAGTSKELRNELNQRAWNDTYPRFASRPAAMDYGRYAKFEEFLFKMGAIPARNPVSKLAIDVTAP
ncbi:MAG: transporter ATP-binding protein [Hyphomicrobiales bacterium]|nr:transporter ATP-binding protein [Hyphomicrobiales bacterium]